jgi:hypothetical protein
MMGEHRGSPDEEVATEVINETLPRVRPDHPAGHQAGAGQAAHLSRTLDPAVQRAVAAQPYRRPRKVSVKHLRSHHAIEEALRPHGLTIEPEWRGAYRLVSLK